MADDVLTTEHPQQTLPGSDHGVVRELRARFGDNAFTFQATLDRVPTLWVAREQIVEVLRFLKQLPQPYSMLLDLSAVDGDPTILAIARRKAAKANAEIQWLQALSTELPFPALHFDRVVSSLFFHHLTWDAKLRTAREVFRVTKAGGELHVADWGRPQGRLMRGLFVGIQLFDGFENTRDNVAGRLLPLFEQAGFVDVTTTQAFNTMFGTLALYRATKPAVSSAVNVTP